MRRWHIALLAALLAVGMITVATGPASGTHDHTSTHTWGYTVKFLCGTQEDNENEEENPVVAGQYQTAINVHNPSRRALEPGPKGDDFRKKVLVLYPAHPDAPGFEAPQPPTQWFNPPVLQPDWGFEIDCPDIRHLLEVAEDNRADDAFIKGFVVIEARSADVPIDVVAAYTGHGFTDENTATGEEEEEEGFSEEIETISPKRVK